MKTTVNKLSPAKVEVLCDLEEKAWKDALEKALNDLAKNMEIKGFRKGKAPLALVRARIDQGRLFNEAINDVLVPTYDEMLAQEKLEPFARPQVDVSKVSADELELKFTILLRPEVELGEYKDLGFKKEPILVTDEEVEDSIKKLVEQSADLVLAERPAKLGDTVVIDFLGTINGTPFEGGKGENHSLELGSGSFIPGFEDQLVGHGAGEDVDVKVTFPKDYVPELAGKEAVFKVKIHEVKEKIIPPLDDALVKDLDFPNVKTPADLRAYQKARLGAEKKSKADADRFEAIVDKIVKNSKITIADEIIEEEAGRAKDNLTDQLKKQGLTLEGYLAATKDTEENLDKKLKEDAEKNLKGYLVLEKIADVENIVVEDDELDFEMAKIAEDYKMPVDKVKEIVGKDTERFKSDVRRRRLHDFLVNANVA